MPLYSWLLTFREDLSREMRERYVRTAIDYCGDRYILHREDNQTAAIQVKSIQGGETADIRARLNAEHEGLGGIETIEYCITTTSEDMKMSREDMKRSMAMAERVRTSFSW